MPDHVSSFMDFQLWDFPGQLDYFDPAFDAAEIFSDIGALVRGFSPEGVCGC